MLAGVLFLQESAVTERQYSGGVITYEVSAGESIASLSGRFGLEPLNEILRRKAGRGISLERRVRQLDPTSTW
jgi:hypothetical protein